MKKQPLNKKKSLHDVMNDLVSASSVRQVEKALPPTVEAEAFLAIDPLLASLHKQKLDAQAHYRKLKSQHGTDDPMTGVAADMCDSAGTAIETRLIELRRDRAKVLLARRLVKQALAEAEEERRVASLQYRLRLQLFYDEQRRREKLTRAQAEESEWRLFVFWMIQLMGERAQMARSLAHHFSGATAKEAA